MEFEFIAPGDKPAMALLSTTDWLETSKAVLRELGYKVHAPPSHEEFSSRFTQIQYEVVLTEPLFAASNPSENLSLLSLQRMPMMQRRHAVVILIGNEFETLNAMQAYQQSVHGVVHPRQLSSLGQIVRQVVSDTSLLMTVFRDTQARIAAGKL